MKSVALLTPSELVIKSFDENWYFTKYIDLAQAKEAGTLSDGLEHFVRHGFAEGRAGFPFDSEWYLHSYPLAVEEITEGRASSAMEHYLTLGKARGWLPFAAAVRPHNAAAMEREFGGLWIDLPNASDIIAGRLETGQITIQDAELLNSFVRDGYVVLRNAIPPALLSEARSALDDAYAGAHPRLRFECHQLDRNHLHWRPEINPFPAKALDLHMFSAAIRDLIFAPAIMRFLGQIFEARPLASQTLGFLRGSAQPAHQDSAYVVYSIARQFAASWIALEDVSAEAGELFYYPGSHKFTDYLYAGQHKSVSEAMRNGMTLPEAQEAVRQHEASLPERANALGLAKQTFLAKAGDVLIWHADLAHGGQPVSKTVTRKSVVTHYCPRFLAPAFMEKSPLPLFQHHSGGRFTTHLYADTAEVS